MSYTKFNDYGDLEQFDEDERLETINICEICDNFSFKLFEGLENITHLTLLFPDGRLDRMVDKRRLQNIDIYLPNLQYFVINNSIELSEWGADIPSRLFKLETFKMAMDSLLIMESNRNKLIAKCD